MFNDRALPVTEDIMFRWRVLMEEGRKAGHTFSQPDLIIAATALHHGLTVVTRDGAISTRHACPFSPRGYQAQSARLRVLYRVAFDAEDIRKRRLSDPLLRHGI